jgi:hypothetical protein
VCFRGGANYSSALLSFINYLRCGCDRIWGDLDGPAEIWRFEGGSGGDLKGGGSGGDLGGSGGDLGGSGGDSPRGAARWGARGPPPGPPPPPPPAVPPGVSYPGVPPRIHPRVPSGEHPGVPRRISSGVSPPGYLPGFSWGTTRGTLWDTPWGIPQDPPRYLHLYDLASFPAPKKRESTSTFFGKHKIFPHIRLLHPKSNRFRFYLGFEGDSGG